MDATLWTVVGLGVGLAALVITVWRDVRTDMRDIRADIRAINQRLDTLITTR